jgi:uncharacterized membrane protein YozB (DUF420 family)
MPTDYYRLAATITLAVQIVILILLLGGYSLKRMKKFRQHGMTMLVAVVLHIITILAVMLPSLATVIPLVHSNTSTVLTIVAPLHGIIGIIAAVLGVWIVTSWRLRAPVQYCAAKKKLMCLTLTLWLIALFLGILLYLHFYTPVLP